jgi:signal transduction histidine kinase
MLDGNQVISVSHDHALVALSVFISILGAYAALALYQRLADARGRAWIAWVVGAAAVDALGTWSMHYTGKLALRLPIDFYFDWPLVVLSLLVSFAGSAAALLVLRRGTVAWPWVLVAGILLGIAISGLHYTAMAAMRLQAYQHHSPGNTALAVGLAVLISVMALMVTFLFPGEGLGRRLRYHAGAWLRGAANPAMHYTAMAGLTFSLSTVPPDLSHAVSISSLGILGISIVPLMLLVVALLTSLLDRLRRASSDLTRMSRRLVEMQDRERRALAAELHDIVGQTLSALNIQLALIRSRADALGAGEISDDLQDASRVVKQSVADLRSVMAQLRPPGADDLGLASALRWHAERLESRTGIKTEVEADETLPRPAARVEDTVLRLLVEALNNVSKHSRAASVRVELEAKADRIVLSITDDGQGFNTAAGVRRDDESGWGLMIMKERAASVGGELRLHSAPGAGSRIEFRISNDRWS